MYFTIISIHKIHYQPIKWIHKMAWNYNVNRNLKVAKELGEIAIDVVLVYGNMYV